MKNRNLLIGVIIFIVLYSVVLTFGLLTYLDRVKLQKDNVTQNDEETVSQKSDEEEESVVVSQTSNPDFRNTKWGMSKEEIKQSENAVVYDEDNKGMSYSVTVQGFDAKLIYQVNEKNELYSAGYIFKQQHTNENQYLFDYRQLYETLCEKYGENKTFMDGMYWYDTFYKYDSDDWGLAVSLGDMQISHVWFTPTTRVGMLLSGDNFEINLVILYESLEIPRPENTTDDL